MKHPSAAAAHMFRLHNDIEIDTTFEEYIGKYVNSPSKIRVIFLARLPFARAALE